MQNEGYNLAIETSTRVGSVAIGRGGQLLDTVALAAQKRHAVGLMPAINHLCDKHGCGPKQIGEIYISIGPGSFTGLRVGVTIAKVIGYATGAKLVAVPTLRVVAANAPAGSPRIAVMLNAKGGRCFTGIFEGDDPSEACLMTPEALCAAYRGPLIGDCLPDYDWPSDITPLDPSLAQPKVENVWRLGRTLADAEQFTTPHALTPLYVRQPDAEEVWQRKQAQNAT